MIPFGVTSADFVELFPEFTDVAPTTITSYLSQASIFVDESWPENIGPLALSNVAAHTLVQDGHLQQTSQASVPSQSQIAQELAKLPGLTSFQIDDLSVSFASQSAAIAADPNRSFEDRFNETRYGRFYTMLRDKYFGGGQIV